MRIILFPRPPLGLSPFECCLGYQPPLFASQESQSSVPSVERFIQRCKRTWRRVRSALCRTRTRTHRAANRHPGPVPQVCLWSEGVAFHPQSAHPGGFSQADAPLCWALFYCQGSQSVAIKLRLSRQLRRVHPVFHVSCVKPVFRAPTRPLLPPPPIDKEASIYRVRKLLDVRPRGRGHQFLVDWEGYGPEERRWIPARDVLDRSLIEDFSTVLVRLLSRERLVALVERGVLS